MASSDNSGLFDIGVDILNSSVSAKTNKILLQTGDNNGDGQTDSDNVALWQHVGFASRPANPEKGKASSQAFIVRQGGVDACIATQDVRACPIYGALKPGETCLYSMGPDGTAQARILLKADGSINLFTKEGNVAGGAGMGLFVNADGSISMTSSTGAALLVGTDGSIKLFNASGGIQVLENGDIKVGSSGKVVISGGSVTMGGPAALPIATGPATATCIAALQAQIVALQVECAAIAGALAACMNIPGPILPPHGTAALAATAAVGVAAGVLTGAAATVATNAALVPSKRTSSD